MNIFITGINGFIGSNLAKHLHAQGNKIYGGSRALEPNEDIKGLLSGYYRLCLDRDSTPSIFNGINAVIHCAYADKGKDMRDINVEGTKKWFFSAREYGADIQIFITTYSAGKDAKSAYGKIKYEIETFFAAQRQPVVRPGLVLGEGGMFGRLGRAVTDKLFVPIIDQGRDPVPIVSIHTLCCAMNMILSNPSPGKFNIFQEEMVTMRELLEEIKDRAGSRCRFINVPSALPLVALKTLETLHIPFPIKSGSIRALKEFHSLVLESSLPEMGLRDKPYKEIIKDLFSKEKEDHS